MAPSLTCLVLGLGCLEAGGMGWIVDQGASLCLGLSQCGSWVPRERVLKEVSGEQDSLLVEAVGSTSKPLQLP